MKEKNAYEVRYEALTQAEHKGNHRKTAKPEWSLKNEPIHVLANGTARAAIDKAEEFLLSVVTSFEDEFGRPFLERNLKVRITSPPASEF